MQYLVQCTRTRVARKKISVMVCTGLFALDQPSTNGIGLINRSEKMKCYIHVLYIYIYIHICHVCIYIYSIYIYVDIPTISPSLISVRRVAMCIQDIGGRHGPTGATEALVRHLLTHRASASGNFRPQSDHWKMGTSWEIPYKYGKIWELLKKLLGKYGKSPN